MAVLMTVGSEGNAGNDFDSVFSMDKTPFHTYFITALVIGAHLK
jgi:hypothetical protein